MDADLDDLREESRDVKKLLTVQEVADLLAVPTATLYRWRYNDSGPPALRVGKYLRYDADSLERWLEGQGAVGSGHPAA